MHVHTRRAARCWPPALRALALASAASGDTVPYPYAFARYYARRVASSCSSGVLMTQPTNEPLQ
eukprot:scaffold454_cov124-Isochrysis_galbana.AAC.29